MPFFVNGNRWLDIDTFLVFLFEVRRDIRNCDIDINSVLFENWLVLLLQPFFLEVEAKIVVLDSDRHRAGEFFWIVHPSLFFFNQITCNLDCSKIKFESLVGLAEIRHDNQWAAEIKI